MTTSFLVSARTSAVFTEESLSENSWMLAEQWEFALRFSKGQGAPTRSCAQDGISVLAPTIGRAIKNSTTNDTAAIHLGSNRIPNVIVEIHFAF